MNKNIFGNLIFFITFILCGAVVAIFDMFTMDSVLDIFINIVLIFLGCLITSYIHIILHEVGHLIAGLNNNFKLFSFRVGSIELIKINGKMKIRKNSLEKNYGGVCQMYPINSENLENNFYNQILGGILMSIILTLIFGLLDFLPLFTKVNNKLYLLYVSGFPIGLYFTITNLSRHLGLQTMTDGAYLYAIRKKLPSGIAIIRLLLIQSLFQNGKRPNEIDNKLINDFPVLQEDDSTNFLVWSTQFICYLDKGEVEKATKISKKMEDNINNLPDFYYKDILSDIFLCELLLKNNIKKATEIYKNIEKDLEQNDNIESLMIKAFYQIVTNSDIENGKANIEKAIQLKDSYHFVGIAKMYEEILKYYQKNINELVNLF